MEMNDKAILQFVDLDISFRTNAGVVHAIRGVNLDLQKGETVAIVGESGSGKSVTCKAAVGLLDANAIINSGQILYRYKDDDGNESVVDLLAMPKRELRSKINGSRIAMVFQDPMTSLDPTMTIGAQIMEGILLHKRTDKESARKRALELLNLVGITHAEERINNYPHQLSGGMRQRVVIAIALACDPDILICDEPTTALDVTIQARILELIKDVQAELGLSVIYITHDLGVVAKVADYVNVMYAGKIIEVGNVNEIFYEPCHPYTWGLLAAMPDLETDDDRLASIPGSPPNLLHEPTGDAFAARNAYALAIDEKADPPMFRVSETHTAATWLLHPDAPKVEMPEELRARIERSRKEAESYHE
jgi:oligopeptide transport system ATP-binding protein